MEATPNRPRLLVVDDEVAICELIREVAMSVGYDVEMASDPEAIDVALGSGHDLTVLDLSLIDDDGVNAMRTLSSRAPGSAIIVASGAPDRVLGSAQRVAGMYGLRVVGACAKPLSIASLQELLESAIAGSAATISSQLSAAEITQRVTDMKISDVQVAYQPVIDLRTGAVVSAEAMARWHHGTSDALAPADFIPELERAGESGTLLEHVTRQVAADRLAYSSLAQLPTIAINVSARDLDSLELPHLLHDILTPVAPAQRWSLEITETATTVAPERALDVITRLSLMEFRLAIDDFGTGSSNLERLRWYPFTELKIDRSFLAEDATGSVGDWIIVKNAVSLAQQLGLEVVAEGVEDTRMLRRLRDLGCDRAQGYLMSPAVPAGEFEGRCVAWAQTAASIF